MKAAFASAVEVLGRPRSSRVPSESETSMKDGPDASLAARALRGMGYNKIEMGDLDAAENLFRQSQEYDPGSEAAKVELGYIARKKAIGS